MLSVLIHQDFNTLLHNNIYPSIAVKVIEHEHSETGNDKDKAVLDLGLSSISEYAETQEDHFLFIKIGGEPQLIQDENYYCNDLEKNGYFFFLQIDEEGYPDNLLNGNYPFGFGALYLYKHKVTEEVVAGFWQYS